MKIRKGFVSNSSSSSFICDITGEVTESGYEDYSELGICTCVNGHNFFYGDYDKVETYLREDPDSQDGDQYYALPEELCPICNGEAKPKLVKRMKAEIKRLKLTLDDLK